MTARRSLGGTGGHQGGRRVASTSVTNNGLGPDEQRRLDEDVRVKREAWAKAGSRYYSFMGWLLAAPLIFVLVVVVIVALAL